MTGPDTVGASQIKTSVNRQTSSTDTNRQTGALSAAFPNATVTQAHTPARANAPQNITQADVVTSLSGLIGGRGTSNSRDKARDLIRHLPENSRTPEGLQNLANAFENHGNEVSTLLHSTHTDYPTDVMGNASKRRELRISILDELAAGRTVDQAREHKNALVACDGLAKALNDRDIIGGSRMGVKGRARDLANFVADGAWNAQSLNRLKDTVTNNPEEITNLINFGQNQITGSIDLASAQALLLTMKAKGRPQEQIDRFKDNLLGINYTASKVTTDAEFADANIRGTPVTPVALDFAGNDSRAIIQRALGNDGRADQELRVATTHTRLGATRPDYLMTHSLDPCQPVVVFWKDTHDQQFATLFHVNAPQEIAIYEATLNDISPDMKIDSINWIKRAPGQHQARMEKAEKYEQNLNRMASQLLVPLNVINRPSRDTDVNIYADRASAYPTLAIAVDVQRGKIAFMDQNTIIGPDNDQSIDLPWPERDSLISEESVNLDQIDGLVFGD